MRIEATYQLNPFAGLRGGRIADDAAFAVAQERPRIQRAAARKAAGLSGIASLLALQGIDDVDPREEGLRRGNEMLDLLEELKIAALENSPSTAQLDTLAAMVADLPETTGHPGLDGALAEVSLRVQIELAKRGR